MCVDRVKIATKRQTGAVIVLAQNGEEGGGGEIRSLISGSRRFLSTIEQTHTYTRTRRYTSRYIKSPHCTQNHSHVARDNDKKARR